MRLLACHKSLSEVTVLLTRRKESNQKAKNALLRRGINSMELPLIEFKTRPEARCLPRLLKTQYYDWITITSPHAAGIFQAAWTEADRPNIQVATFEGSAKELDGVSIGFMPSISNGEHIAKELPIRGPDGCSRVLYPASSKADDALERGLRERHFIVTRLDIYDTGTVDRRTISTGDLERAVAADILTFASPTAVQAWVDISAELCDFSKPVACIGATTGNKARTLGFQNVYFSEIPGLERLVHSVESILYDSGLMRVDSAVSES